MTTKPDDKGYTPRSLKDSLPVADAVLRTMIQNGVVRPMIAEEFEYYKHKYAIIVEDTLKRERDEARAEVERLREALRKIEDLTHATPDDHDFMELCDQVNEIAQAAIKGEK